MPQRAILRPMGEPNLGYQLWPHPERLARWTACLRCEGRLSLAKRLQRGTQLGERSMREAGPHSPRVDQSALAVVVAQQQRAESLARALGQREAADTNSLISWHLTLSQS